MCVPPRKGDESIFAGGMLFKIVLRGLLIGVSSILAFMFAYKNSELAGARTAAMVTLSLSQLIFVFECKNECRGIFNTEYLKNPKLIFAVLISLLVTLGAVYFPPLSAIFDTVSLNSEVLFISLAAAAAVPVIRGIGLLFKGRESENNLRPLTFSEK